MRAFGGTFREPTEADLAFVASHMREADRRELKRWTAQEPDYELRHSVAVSDFCRTGVFGDGAVACVFGAARANLVDGTAVLWSLSTDEVDSRPREFCLGSRAGLDLLMRSMPDVGEFLNFVDQEYEAAVRWIEWFGGTFSITTPSRAGVRGGVFRQFYVPNPYYKED